jgi:hypothetical protein
MLCIDHLLTDSTGVLVRDQFQVMLKPARGNHLDLRLSQFQLAAPAASKPMGKERVSISKLVRDPLLERQSAATGQFLASPIESIR